MAQPNDLPANTPPTLPDTVNTQAEIIQSYRNSANSADTVEVLVALREDYMNHGGDEEDAVLTRREAIYEEIKVLRVELKTLDNNISFSHETLLDSIAKKIGKLVIGGRN